MSVRLNTGITKRLPHQQVEFISFGKPRSPVRRVIHHVRNDKVTVVGEGGAGSLWPRGQVRVKLQLTSHSRRIRHWERQATQKRREASRKETQVSKHVWVDCAFVVSGSWS